MGRHMNQVNISRRMRLHGLVAAGLLTAGLASVSSAHSAPVFTTSNLDTYSGSYSSHNGCAAVDHPTPDQMNVPVIENGAPTATSSSNSGTLTNNADSTDVISFATSSTSTGRVTSVNGNPGVLELTTTGTVEVSTTKPTAGCGLAAYSGAALDFVLAVAQGGFMTFTTRAHRYGYQQVNIHGSVSGDIFEMSGYGATFPKVTSVYLSPGTYDGTVELDVYVRGASTAIPLSQVDQSITGTFVVGGTQTEQASGAGKRYVLFPAGRSCATDSLDAMVTRKGKRSKQIRKIALFVNDALVKTVRNPRKGQPVRLPIAGQAHADVRAEITLKPTKPNRRPKTREVTAAYVACSAD
jgi:hypothetical protein